jgi:hypothetical protein
MRKQYPKFKAIPAKRMTPDQLVAYKAHRTATRKMRAELRMRGLPIIICKDGKVLEIPA